MTTAKAYTEYINKGGTINVLPGFLETKPLPAAKHPEKPSANPKDYSNWYSSKDISEDFDKAHAAIAAYREQGEIK